MRYSVSATSKASDQPAHTLLRLPLEYSMIVKLLTEHQLEVLSLKGGCTGSCQNVTLLENTCRGLYYFTKVSLDELIFPSKDNTNKYTVFSAMVQL